MEKIYKDGIRFYRCGEGLLDISDKSNVQFDMFNPTNIDSELMQCMDKINNKYVRGEVHLAGWGIELKFAMRRVGRKVLSVLEDAFLHEVCTIFARTKMQI